MDRTYLQEAFHAMELLEEEDFRLDNLGIKDILDFKDHDELNDIVDVIDPEAETEEELEDTYIGKVILECEVCHSPIFKDVENVEIGKENNDVVNINEECPICHSNDGFKVIGQVCPFKEEPELRIEIEDKDSQKISNSNNEIEDTSDEEKNELLKEELDQELEEKLDSIEDKLEDIIDCFCAGDAEGKEDSEDLSNKDTEESVEKSLLGDASNKEVDAAKNVLGLNESRKRDLWSEVYNELSSTRTGVHNQYKIPAGEKERYKDLDPTEISSYAGELPDGIEAIKVSVDSPEKLNFAKKVAANFSDKGVEYKELKSNQNEYNALLLIPINESLEDNKTAKSQFDEIVDYCNIMISDKRQRRAELKRRLDSLMSKHKLDPEYVDAYNDVMSKIGFEARGRRLRNEGFEKIDLETEDKIIHVSEEEKKQIPDAEMISPVSPELEAELTNDTTEQKEDISNNDLTNEMSVDEVSVEDFEDKDNNEEDHSFDTTFDEPVEEAYNHKLAKDEEESVDFELDDFDDERFNKLSEGYLKKVYENVDSFTTTSAKTSGQSLIIEGSIKFNSGKNKATTFVFEAYDATKDGKLRFIGENKQISRGKKSFTLTGFMNGNNFISESLKYNYRQKTNEGVSTRVYGTVKLTENIDEGILDKIKTGINTVRAKSNTKQSIKSYNNDNFVGGKNFNDSAAGYTRDAGYAKAHNKYSKSDATLEGNARHVVNKRYTNDIDKANEIHQAKLTNYTDRLMKYLRQCATENDVDEMANDQWNVIRDRNSNDPEIIRELGNLFDNAVDMRKKEIRNSEANAENQSQRQSTRFK